jgi:glutamate 5-kinase
VLLTREDLDDRVRYLNASHALHTLLSFGAVPVINENDTVSVEEITFSDNDILSALVANLLRADLLILLSVVQGLYDGARVLPVVQRITDDIRALATGERSEGGKGGMESKLEAAAIATRAGAAVVLACGGEPNVLVRLMEGEALGTLFVPAPMKMQGRKRWIGFGGRPKGRIIVDEGARAALIRGGKSLLPSGVTGVSGEFARGDVVAIAGPDGREFARGLVNFSAKEIGRIKGLRSSAIATALGEKLYDEVIHRDNLVVREEKGA